MIVRKINLMNLQTLLIFTILSALLLQAPGESKAQNTFIDGTITDISNRPLMGIDVYLVDTNKGASTNAKGYFKIQAPAGIYTLKISAIGFETITREIDIQNQSSIEIILNEKLYELPGIVVERETLTGGNQFLTNIPGSAHYISTRQLEKYNYSDVNRILRNVPGINIQEEEGFGLRPNIGMRGTGVERSSKITLMEDGVLAAPAPYTAPAAYYFPTAGRMQGVEVRKGSSQIKYGPYTTGGAINFLSSDIPQDLSAKVNIIGGNYGRRTIHANIGQSFEHGGFVVETFQNSATGFKDLDNGGSTGFDASDYLAKVRFNSSPSAKIYQAITFKLGQATGDADETYLGLTDEDFNSTPYRRYSASQLDNIKTKHNQYSVRYNVIPTKFMDISLTAYRNDFERNWYKLDAVKYDASAKVSIANVLDDPETYVNEYNLITGSTSPNDNALFVRNNNREYYSQGVQGIVGFNFDSNSFKHDIEVGFRVHRDEEDRFQSDDEFKMENGVLELTKRGAPGSQSNQVSDTKAFSSYVQYSFQHGKLLAIPGIRYEKMDINRVNYGSADPERTGSAIVRSSNSADAFIPGIGLQYEFTKGITGLAGVHRGFAPAGASEGADPEKSINYEMGGRFNSGTLNAQAILFFNDYENLLGSDLSAAGGGGTGDQFNAGQARIYGLETELSYYISLASEKFALPFSIGYTYTYGQFLSSFASTNEDWGRVENGDELPYLANHQLSANMSLEHKKFNVNVSSKYVGDMRTTPGQGELVTTEMIRSNFIVDISSTYKITRHVSVFGSINNIMDEEYAVARRPAGLRPGMPRSFQIGVKAVLN